MTRCFVALHWLIMGYWPPMRVAGGWGEREWTILQHSPTWALAERVLLGDDRVEQSASGEMELFSELLAPRAVQTALDAGQAPRDAVGLKLPTRMRLLLTLLIPPAPCSC